MGTRLLMHVFNNQLTHLTWWPNRLEHCLHLQSVRVLNPARVKPVNLRLIFVAPFPGAWHYLGREGTGWLSVKILWLSGRAGYGASRLISLMSQWGSTIKVTMSVQCYKSVPPPGLVPQLWSTASYLRGPLVSISSSAIVTVLRQVPFPKCASSNSTATQITHTYVLCIHSNCVLTLHVTFIGWKIKWTKRILFVH